jgi:hypothetical protein
MTEQRPESEVAATGGLEVLNTDEVTPAELAEFRKFYDATKGSQNKSYEYWFEFRPDVVKRHKARTRQWYLGEGEAVQALTQLHQYVIEAFDDGIDYETRLAQTYGASKGDVLDTISVAFIHSGHPGMYTASGHADYLRSYEAGPRDQAFPPNWDTDYSVFASGMDFSSLTATPDDLASLRDWYQRTLGEIPASVEFMARYRPDLLKAYRNRYEHAIRDSLPAQMLPYMMLHYNTYRGNADGIRENVLLGRALGLTRPQVLNAIMAAVLHGGSEILGLVDQTVGDLLPGFPD